MNSLGQRLIRHSMSSKLNYKKHLERILHSAGDTVIVFACGWCLGKLLQHFWNLGKEFMYRVRSLFVVSSLRQWAHAGFGGRSPQLPRRTSTSPPQSFPWGRTPRPVGLLPARCEEEPSWAGTAVLPPRWPLPPLLRFGIRVSRVALRSSPAGGLRRGERAAADPGTPRSG